ncbi:MAG: branched-chain amino acid transport system permease protein [Haloarculaceae archaeon]|jgi:branched-chain amino acid transport system permease protein
MSYEGDSGLRSIVSEHESLLLLANAIALLLLPLGLIEGFAIIGEIIEFITVSISNLTGFAVGYGPSLGGYTALSPLILIYGIVVIGFNLLLGYTGLLSFGHAAFFGTGAYVAGISSSMVGDPILMVAVGAIAATIIAWPIGFVSIRRSGVYFAVLTLTFGQMLYFYALGPGSWLTNGDNGYSSIEMGNLLTLFPLDEAVIDFELVINVGVIPLLPLGEIALDFDIYTWMYILVAVFALLALWAASRILSSPYGLIFDALGQNEQRVSFVGLNVFRYKLMAFILSAVFAGVGGALWAMHEQFIHPGTAYFWIQSGDFVIMTILGGAGSLVGPIFGAFIFEYVANVTSGLTLPIWGEIGSLWRVVLGLTFVVVIWKLPRGLYPPVRDRLYRVADRILGYGGESK